VTTSELTWDAPGPGDWWVVTEHFPYSVSHMFASLFPAVTIGWKDGAAHTWLGDRKQTLVPQAPVGVITSA
jgi:hypothetical protein